MRAAVFHAPHQPLTIEEVEIERPKRREILLRRMREQGALAMEFLPGHLSSEIVNQYLQIKSKGLL